ncbi:MAG: ABC transporter ATP-binding protein [Acidobacteria bacterium]|nr:ABC transporter ATP-binding protein [Acidobacteriota bacterium]
MWKLARLALPYKAHFVAALFSLIMAAFFGAALTATVKPLFDEVLATGPKVEESPSRVDQIFKYQDEMLDDFKTWLQEAGISLDRLGMGDGGFDLENPLPWALLVLVVFLAQSIFEFLGTYTMGRIGLHVVVDVRRQLLEHVMSLPLQFFKSFGTGDVLSRVNNDVTRIQNAISSKVGELIKEGTLSIVLVVLLFWMSFKASLVLFVLVPLIGGPVVYFTRKIRKNAQRSQAALGKLSAHLKEVLVGVRIVKAFNREQFEANRLDYDNRSFLKYALRELLIVSLTTPVIGFVGIVVIVSFVSFGSYVVQTTNLSSGDFMVYVLFIYQLYQPIKRMARANSELQQAAGVLPRIEEVLAWKNDILEPKEPVRPGPFPQVEQIAFDHVSFTYQPGKDPAVHDVSFQVACGTTVALVGASGSGKSTLVNLLPRFYDPTSGRILIDGVDIRQMSKRDLRDLIGVVTQDTILFDDTVHNNIAYGSVVDREQVRAAAEQAYAHEFIDHLDYGYDTMIGESGNRLSGGQRQRISIARAILKNAPILILDEATSALDTESERVVQLALDNLMMQKTTIVVAHRLSTIRRADCILVMEQGRVVERGNHKSLMGQNGAYQRLIRLQEGSDAI